MFRTLISKAAGGLAGATLLLSLAFVVTPAGATTVNISGVSCTSSGTPPNDTLSCTASSGGTGVPTGCSIQGPVNGSVGSPVALTASCSGGGAPTGFSWTSNGASCNGTTTNPCMANESNAGQVTYAVAISNASGAATNSPGWTVTWGSGSVAPNGCTLSPASQTVSSGASASLTAACSGGTMPITINLSGGGFTQSVTQNTSSGATVSATVSSTTTVTATASNASGGATFSNSATITVSGGGGGGAGLANCTAQGITVLGGNAINIPWGVSQGGVSNSSGSFGNNMAWVFQMTVPAGTPNTGSVGIFEVAENGGQGGPKNLTISKTPCDFRAQDTSGANGPLQVCRNGSTCDIYFQVSPPTFFGNFAGLTAGTTYYINVRNYDDFSNNNTGGYNCSGGNCPTVYNVQPTR
jgi:hypothetical protein